ncbi:putative nucleolar complex protein 14 [Fusarium oxysporum f. sp. albedinis]|nr:putative fructose-bisphosphate aldolase [Fusarium oxysporum f. sp. albedinis]KAJ0135187.1 putative nucleolar complex protein 14 [Fusarium oxysporum f. sp. albedinis]
MRRGKARQPLLSFWGAKLHQTDKSGHRIWKQYEPQSVSRSPQVAWNRDDNNITTNLSTIKLYLPTTTTLDNQK